MRGQRGGDEAVRFQGANFDQARGECVCAYYPSVSVFLLIHSLKYMKIIGWF